MFYSFHLNSETKVDTLVLQVARSDETLSSTVSPNVGIVGEDLPGQLPA